jgi:hypothetical protein
MNKIELEVITDHLESRWGTPEYTETLDRLIDMHDAKVRQWDAKRKKI